jgi:hypothetical protein
MELGYHVTLVRDATVAFTREMMDAAHELNGPTYAHAILTTAELIAALPKSYTTEPLVGSLLYCIRVASEQPVAVSRQPSNAGGNPDVRYPGRSPES